MKASDYIVKFLINKGINHVFGYPGGMVTHLMESFRKYSSEIIAHETYHEQAAAFAACGYAQASCKTGIAYATSGPGATNLITGVCNAYFDSIPCFFITGQVNTFESNDEWNLRQRGFQETDIVAILKPVTKYAKKVSYANDIKYELEKAFDIANSGRKGPVLLDIPMNILREEINEKQLRSFKPREINFKNNFDCIRNILDKSRRPVILVGNGVYGRDAIENLRKLISKTKIPVVTTMLAIDKPCESYGFIGAYGHRVANFIVAKSDCILSLGARLDIRQVGKDRDTFAPNAKIIRIDIDNNELDYKVHDDEFQINSDSLSVLEYLNKHCDYTVNTEWCEVCSTIKHMLSEVDDSVPTSIVKKLSNYIPDNCIITTDVGQNQVWISQAFSVKPNQKVLFSGGHGAMGYSLPAAYGSAIASGKTVFCFTGDGGFQMNIQELQAIVSESLPIKIILFNNHSLGMIRHFQEMYFQKNYFQTTFNSGYTNPNFEAISKAYNIPYTYINSVDSINGKLFKKLGPQFIEIDIDFPTYVLPKLVFGEPNQDQDPKINRNLYNKIMSL